MGVVLQCLHSEFVNLTKPGEERVNVSPVVEALPYWLASLALMVFSESMPPWDNGGDDSWLGRTSASRSTLLG